MRLRVRIKIQAWDMRHSDSMMGEESVSNTQGFLVMRSPVLLMN
jgi:hypothetical protein